jgi:hypothetical protein
MFGVRMVPLHGTIVGEKSVLEKGEKLSFIIYFIALAPEVVLGPGLKNVG